ISHDVYFIRAIATTVLHINAGQLTPYAGDYDYYLEKSRATSAREALTSNGQTPNIAPPVAEGLRETRERRRAEAEQRKAEAKVKRDHEKRLREIEMHILSLEGRQKELTAELENPETYERGGAAMELNRELLGLNDELARATAEWEKLAQSSQIAAVGTAAAK
ncbi:MAG: ABC transporter ATP-binding protein, partial [Chthoniobacterales bacterium]